MSRKTIKGADGEIRADEICCLAVNLSELGKNKFSIKQCVGCGRTAAFGLQSFLFILLHMGVSSRTDSCRPEHARLYPTGCDGGA